ncbi:hypothetical protein M1N59_00085 [Dehalococcoidales bacterium]|nr:hypothetical protein [Dehalococcoidales bacterium]
MQIRKTYKQVNPELLYDEVRDFILKQEVIVDSAKLETYAYLVAQPILFGAH